MQTFRLAVWIRLCSPIDAAESDPAMASLCLISGYPRIVRRLSVRDELTGNGSSDGVEARQAALLSAIREDDPNAEWGVATQKEGHVWNPRLQKWEETGNGTIFVLTESEVPYRDRIMIGGCTVDVEYDLSVEGVTS